MSLSDACHNHAANDSTAGAGSVITGSDIGISAVTFFNSAKTGDVIRIISPVIDETATLEAIERARRRGVVFKILTTLVDRHGIKTKGWDSSQNIDIHYESIRRLAKCGCMLRSPKTTPHAKMILSSKGSLWFGSANLAANALNGNSVEVVIESNETSLASYLQNCFESIWNSAIFRMVYQQGSILVDETGAAPLTLPASNIINDISVWCAAPEIDMGTTELIRLFDAAKREILLVAMSLYELDHTPELHQALQNAMRRGVKVKALIRKDHFEKEELRGEYPDPGTRSLMTDGMELLRLKGLHAKGFLVDDRWCGIQSANFNPYSLDWRRPECNVELVIAADCKHPLMTGYAKWMRGLLAQAYALSNDNHRASHLTLPNR